MQLEHSENILALGLMLPAVMLAVIFLSKSKFVSSVAVLVATAKIALILWNSFGHTFFPYDADFYTINLKAEMWARMPLSSMLSELPQATGRYFFSFLLAILYRTVGEAYLYVLLANVFLTALVSTATYDFVRQVTSEEKIARICFLLVALFPMYTVYCLTPSREPLVEAGFAVAIKYFFAWVKDKRPSRIWVVAGGLLVCAAIHSAMAIALLVTMLFIAKESFFPSGSKNSARRTQSIIALSLVAVLSLPPVVLSGWALKKFGGSFDVTDTEILDKYSERNDGEDRTGYISSGSVGTFNSASDAAKNLPLRIIYFATKPWPWNISSPVDLLAVYLNLFVVITLFYVIARRKTLQKYPGVNEVALCAALLIVVYSFGTANWGTGTRHKTKFLPGMVVVLAIHITERKRRSQLFAAEENRTSNHV